MLHSTFRNLGNQLYVAYAQQNAGKNFSNSGPGLGYVDVFDTAGNLLQHLVAGAQLNAPWGQNDGLDLALLCGNVTLASVN
jgi:hypothetical protein